MKLKSKKTIGKRFTITSTGKLKHNVGQWNHMRMKKRTKVHQRKAVDRVLASSKQTRILKSYISK